MTGRRTLILGWGNPGRLDDGLGPALVDLMSDRLPPWVALDSDYQLTIEDAADVAQYGRVLFVDADRTGPEPFRLHRIVAEGSSSSFSTHSVSPGAVLALSRDLFLKEPEAWLLGIRGYRFDEFGEVLSDAARSNLDRAVQYIQAAVAEDRFREIRGDAVSPVRERLNEGESCQTPSL